LRSTSAFQRAVTVGVLLLVTLVVLGHYLPWLARQMLFGTMLIAGIAGLLYAREVARGYGAGALGGAFAGGISALVGIAVAVLLGDAHAYTLGPQPELVLIKGTAICIAMGAIGALFGQWDAVRNGRA
jgi:hypothetical protein